MIEVTFKAENPDDLFHQLWCFLHAARDKGLVIPPEEYAMPGAAPEPDPEPKAPPAPVEQVKRTRARKATTAADASDAPDANVAKTSDLHGSIHLPLVETPARVAASSEADAPAGPVSEPGTGTEAGSPSTGEPTSDEPTNVVPFATVELALKGLVRAKGFETAIKTLNGLGVDKLKELPTDQYGKAIETFEAAKAA